MRTLDRYILRNFLLSALLCFVVLMSLRVVADLTVNMKEFTERRQQVDKTAADVFGQIWAYYSVRSFQYFRELGGVIIIAAAAFSLARMNRTNELTAILASGVSLHRVLLPIVLGAVGLNLLVVLDNEVAIPAYKHQLVHSRDDPTGADQFQVRLVADEKGNVLYARRFVPREKAMLDAMVVLRGTNLAYLGHLTAGQAEYDAAAGAWMLTPTTSAGVTHPAMFHLPGWQYSPSTAFIPTVAVSGGQPAVARIRPEDILEKARANPKNAAANWRVAPEIAGVDVDDAALGVSLHADRMKLDHVGDQLAAGPLENVRVAFARADGKPLAAFRAARAVYVSDARRTGYALEGAVLAYATELDPADLSLRQSSEWLQFMSTAELTGLLRLQRLSDPEAAMLTRHTRLADFFNNVLMLLVAVPFILSRERNIKASAGLTVLTVGVFMVFIYAARYAGLSPFWAAWLPVLVFGPVAAFMLDAVKT